MDWDDLLGLPGSVDHFLVFVTVDGVRYVNEPPGAISRSR
jgi:hypothetical protein